MRPYRGSPNDGAAGSSGRSSGGVRRLTASDGETAIRPLELSDTRELLDVRSASREHLAPWEPEREESYFTLEAHRDALASDVDKWEQDRGFSFAVLDARDGRMVGGINLSNVVRGVWQNATLGYWLAATDIGRGHATRAVRLVTAYAFAHCGLHRVQAAVIPRNSASLAVVCRARFRHEGRALHYLRIAGTWEHHEIFAATLEDEADLGLPSVG